MTRFILGMMIVLPIFTISCAQQVVQSDKTEPTVSAESSDSVEPVVAMNTAPKDEGGDVSMEKVVKTDEEWRALLTDEEFRVTRQKGTERAFSGKYWDNKKPGVFACVCCDLELFDTDHKFDSGTGWPSFWQGVEKGRIAYVEDTSFNMVRTEVLCARCDAHLGHVFPDGPEPTGQRYCINSAALTLKPDEAGDADES